MTTKTIDRKVYELLAAHFLFDHPRINTEAARTTLAVAIQGTVEAEIQFMRSQLEKSQ